MKYSERTRIQVSQFLKSNNNICDEEMLQKIKIVFFTMEEALRSEQEARSYLAGQLISLREAFQYD